MIIDEYSTWIHRQEVDNYCRDSVIHAWQTAALSYRFDNAGRLELCQTVPVLNRWSVCLGFWVLSETLKCHSWHTWHQHVYWTLLCTLGTRKSLGTWVHLKTHSTCALKWSAWKLNLSRGKACRTWRCKWEMGGKMRRTGKRQEGKDGRSAKAKGRKLRDSQSRCGMIGLGKGWGKNSVRHQNKTANKSLRRARKAGSFLGPTWPAINYENLSIFVSHKSVRQWSSIRSNTYMFHHNGLTCPDICLTFVLLHLPKCLLTSRNFCKKCKESDIAKYLPSWTSISTYCLLNILLKMQRNHIAALFFVFGPHTSSLPCLQTSILLLRHLELHLSSTLQHLQMHFPIEILPHKKANCPG